ncbi:hypothetical protein CDG76_29740 [Nostoc sp. 'Peltigera membranacea cyanobiont' 210A]|uniref:hypothetical protein n=1 Tax=Nostoc sp. 'Peltigera membranacea cyanobiont' 210A TaxID=2014529 RepID=UPI000B957DFB|nr:hypothetical protein [Nostoc sp. 'Peltigera membranacea cyanobiont' 210A]OYD90901.1 hypothetical protein CDG76_29740 [Nostoc sp. 'Peltigera membranacea cyanobiont' 210A]
MGIGQKSAEFCLFPCPLVSSASGLHSVAVPLAYGKLRAASRREVLLPTPPCSISHYKLIREQREKVRSGFGSQLRPYILNKTWFFSCDRILKQAIYVQGFSTSQNRVAPS